MQESAAHRVEERLGELRLPVVGEQSDVLQLDVLPERLGQRLGLELGLQALDRFAHALVVEQDALGVRATYAGPVRALKALLGFAARLAEQPVVLVEAFQQGARDCQREVAAQV